MGLARLLEAPIAFACAASCNACLAAIEVALPLEGEAQIVLFETAEGVQGVALDRDSRFSFVDTDVTELLALSYPFSLKVMQLASGPLPEPEGFFSLLPTPEQAGTFTLVDDQLRPGSLPVALAVQHPFYMRFRAPTFDPIGCAEVGGCHLGEQERFCIRPCPTPTLPVPPALPESTDLPAFMPCSSGWTEVTEPEHPTLCDPFPSGLPSCGSEDQIPLPSAGGCVAIGSPCPVGPFPMVPAGAPVIYVASGAVAPGDGSLSSPFPRLTDGIAAVPPGGVLALAKGRYDDGQVGVVAPMTILGACPTETTISSTISVSATGVVLQNLTIDGYAVVQASGSLSLSDSIVLGRAASGVEVAGRLDAARVVFGGGTQNALLVVGGANATVEAALLKGTSIHLAAVVGHLTLRDVTVTIGSGTAGILATDGGVLQVEASVIDGLSGTGLVVRERSVAVLRDTVVRNVAVGFEVHSRSRLSLERSWIEEVETGIVSATSSTVSLTDVLVRRTKALPVSCESDGEMAQNRACTSGLRRRAGIHANPTSLIEADRLMVSDSPCGSVYAELAELELHDLTARRSGGICGDQGVAVFAVQSPNTRIERAQILDSLQGFACLGEGETVLRDLRIEALTSTKTGTGIQIAVGCRARLERVSIRGGESGLAFGSELPAVVEDLSVTATGESAVRLLHCSDVGIARVAIEDALGSGVASYGESRSTFRDLRISGTRPTQRVGHGPCLESDCQGFNLLLESSGLVRIEQFQIEDSRRGGAWFDFSEERAAGVDLVDGIFSGNPTGIELFNTSGQGSDPGRLTTRVLFVGHTLDAIADVGLAP